MIKLRSALWLVLSIGANFVCITAYSQVLVSSSNSADADGPRIFKALNTDLIFPKTFNSSENVISTTEIFNAVSTTTEPPSTTSTTAQPPWPYNHRAQTEAPVLPIFVTPSSVSEPPPAATAEIVEKAPQDESQVVERGELTSTGRAVDYRTGYPFGQLLTPLIKTVAPNTVRKRPPSSQGYRQGPRQRKPSGSVYAQPSNGYYRQRQPSRSELNKLKGKATFSDRFSPSQGVAAGIFVRQKENYEHNHNHANDGKAPAASDVVQSYVPPSNPYAFPPLNANYPSPSDDPKAAVPTSSVTSYLPPASGPLLGSEGIAGYKYPGPSMATSGYQYPGPSMASSGYQYPGPVKPAPQDNKSGDDGNANGDDDADNDDTIGVLPASAMDMTGDGGKDANGGNANGAGDSAGADDTKAADDGDDGDDGGGDDMKPVGADGPGSDYDPNKEYPTPPPGWLESHPDSAVPQPTDHDHPHDHDHEHDHPHDYEHDHPHPHDFEHDHHHEHDHGPADYSDIIQYPHGFPSFDSYPDHHPHLIYDDHFPHHYHHHHVEPPPPPPPPLPPTTEPPPEPAPEPRVKKYSYFYIGRKLWYIPLYFTVWFSFYVLWLIVKSIARHKVNLPNHYVNRRSLPDYSDQKRDEYINNLTVSVLGHIDSFRQKYLT